MFCKTVEDFSDANAYVDNPRHNALYVNRREFTQEIIELHDAVDHDFVTVREFNGLWKKFCHGNGLSITCHPTHTESVKIDLPVGYLAVSKETCQETLTSGKHSSRSVYLCYSFGVLHDFRMQGIFRSMVHRAEDIYRGVILDTKQGESVSKFRFAVWDENYSAISALKKLGYSVLPNVLVNERTRKRILIMAVVEPIQ